jgi:hypothetical protein
MEKERGGGRSIIVVLCVVAVLLPVAYVASAGPMEWLMARGYVSYDNPYVKAFYYPGERLMELCPPLNQFVRWFLSFWK